MYPIDMWAHLFHYHRLPKNLIEGKSTAELWRLHEVVHRRSEPKTADEIAYFKKLAERWQRFKRMQNEARNKSKND